MLYWKLLKASSAAAMRLLWACVEAGLKIKNKAEINSALIKIESFGIWLIGDVIVFADLTAKLEIFSLVRQMEYYSSYYHI